MRLKRSYVHSSGLALSRVSVCHFVCVIGQRGCSSSPKRKWGQALVAGDEISAATNELPFILSSGRLDFGRRIFKGTGACEPHTSRLVMLHLSAARRRDVAIWRHWLPHFGGRLHRKWRVLARHTTMTRARSLARCTCRHRAMGAKFNFFVQVQLHFFAGRFFVARRRRNNNNKS